MICDVLFLTDYMYVLKVAFSSCRRLFFHDVIVILPNLPKPARRRPRLSPEEALALEPLPVAEEGEKEAALTEEEMGRLKDHEDRLLNELRIFLREVLGRLLRDRRFSIFTRPIDPDSVPDYFEIIKVHCLRRCLLGLYFLCRASAFSRFRSIYSISHSFCHPASYGLDDHDVEN